MVTSKTNNKDFYAMKALKKDAVLINNDLENTVLERDVCKLGNKNPFITRLFASFQNEVNFYCFKHFKKEKRKVFNNYLLRIIYFF